MLVFSLAVPAFAVSSTTPAYPSGNYIFPNGWSQSGLYNATSGDWFNAVASQLEYSSRSLNFLFKQLINPNVDVSDTQDGEASYFLPTYWTYALHGLKGTMKSTGKFLSFYPATQGDYDGEHKVLNLGSDSKDYFYSNWAHLFSTLTTTDANAMTVHTMTDNSQPSWLFQVAHGVAQSGLSAEGLMNWNNPKYFGSSSFASAASNSWYKAVLDAINNQASSDISSLLPSGSSYSYAIVSPHYAYPYAISKGQGNFWSAIADSNFQSVSLFNDTFRYTISSDRQPLVIQSVNSDGSLVTNNVRPVSFGDSILLALGQKGVTGFLNNINNRLVDIDSTLATENDKALEAETDASKITVKDFISSSKADKGDTISGSLGISNTLTGGLDSGLDSSQANAAVGSLFDTTDANYWGWFSSQTDSDLHPGSSSAVTLSSDDSAPTAQEIADSETVWVIDPYATSSDIISDFFGGD